MKTEYYWTKLDVVIVTVHVSESGLPTLLRHYYAVPLVVAVFVLVLVVRVWVRVCVISITRSCGNHARVLGFGEVNLKLDLCVCFECLCVISL